MPLPLEQFEEVALWLNFLGFAVYRPIEVRFDFRFKSQLMYFVLGYVEVLKNALKLVVINIRVNG